MADVTGRIMSLEMDTSVDLHLHVRQGLRLRDAVRYASEYFAGAIIMPNTQPHTVTVQQALAYREEILSALPSGREFLPLMTLSLKLETTPVIIKEAKSSGFIYGVKLYAGETTNSEGVEDVAVFDLVLAEMEKSGIPLLLHGEAPSHVDVFDREKVFYGETLPEILHKFPGLRIVCEHITTREAVDFVLSTPDHVVATITPQHLLVNRNYMLGSGLRPHAYCKPILKRKEDQETLLAAATSGSSKFFLGTDSAPHPLHGETGKAKYADCGCAGCFTSPVAIALYAEAFDSVGKLEMLPDFASRFGRDFYSLPQPRGQLILVRETYQGPTVLPFGDDEVGIFRSEQPLQWRVTRFG